MEETSTISLETIFITFVAEFFNCKVNTCPLLVTEEGHMITQHVWNITHKNKHKPDKTHDMWKTWKDNIDLDLPPVTKHFNETYTYVWLPFDNEAASNPWHIWIDVISKFRLNYDNGMVDGTTMSMDMGSKSSKVIS